MANIIKLNIISPDRGVITEEVVSLETTSSDGKIEFFANHAPIIVSTVPTVSSFIDKAGNKKSLFTSTGIIHIKNNEINFCCDSVNWPEEIDRQRAEIARERADKRLKSNDDLDKERAKRALARALARLELK